MKGLTLHKGESPLIISFPHSGTELTEGLRERLTESAVGIPDTDWHVPQVYDFSEHLGASRIHAKYSRYVIDMNRDPSGASLYPGQATTGLVPTELFDGAPIYREGQAPDATETEDRRQHYHQPYHAALTELIAAAKSRHGYAVLWDAHSIASVVPRLFEGRLPDLNLGTNEGATCAPRVQRGATDSMIAQSNYKTIANGRFKGGWITRNYGDPANNIHALQMEIAQTAYMLERPPWTFDEDKAALLRPVLKSMIEAALDAAKALHEETAR